MSHGYEFEKRSAILTLKSFMAAAHSLAVTARHSGMNDVDVIDGDDYIKAFEMITKVAIAENPDAAIKALMISTDRTKIYGRDIYPINSAYLDAVDYMFLEAFEGMVAANATSKVASADMDKFKEHISGIVGIYSEIAKAFPKRTDVFEKAKGLLATLDQ